MHVRDIHPTQPDNAIIHVRTESGLVEIEVDDREKMVRVTLDQHKVALLLSALAQALVIVGRNGGSNERT